MATSVGESIMQLILAALNATADGVAPPMPTVRQRTNPMDVTQEDGTSGLNEFLLYAIKEESERISITSVKRRRAIRIEIPVSGPPPLDSAADPYYVYIVQTLFQNTALMQAISLLEEVGLVWETVNSYVDASVCALEINVTYVTTLDPAVAAMSTGS